MTEAWRADRRREVELVRRDGRRVWSEAMHMAILFAVTDIICPHRTLETVMAATLAGTIVGAVASRFAFDRFATCALGLSSMFLLQWSLRGGMTGLHFFVLFPFASACAYLGYVHEQRGQD